MMWMHRVRTKLIIGLDNHIFYIDRQLVIFKKCINYEVNMMRLSHTFLDLSTIQTELLVSQFRGLG